MKKKTKKKITKILNIGLAVLLVVATLAQVILIILN
jgi:flagellar basal body-associated protein FliL